MTDTELIRFTLGITLGLSGCTLAFFHGRWSYYRSTGRTELCPPSFVSRNTRFLYGMLALYLTSTSVIALQFNLWYYPRFPAELFGLAAIMAYFVGLAVAHLVIKRRPISH